MAGLTGGMLTFDYEDGSERSMTLNRKQVERIAEIVLADSRSRVDKLRIAEARALREEGLSYREVADETGLPYWTAFGLVCDIPAANSGNVADPDEDAMAAELYESLGTFKAVAEAMPCDAATARRMVRRHQTRIGDA